MGWLGGHGLPAFARLNRTLHLMPSHLAPPQVWWKVAIVIGVFIIIFCVTAAMLFWDCCKLRSSWKAAVSLAFGDVAGSKVGMPPARQMPVPPLHLPAQHVSAKQRALMRTCMRAGACDDSPSHPQHSYNPGVA